MKKLISLALIASLLSFFCACGQSESAEFSTENLIETQATTAIEENEWIAHPALFLQTYSSYSSLMTAYKEEFPDNYVFPLPEITNTWKLKNTSLASSNYSLYYTDDTNNVDIKLQICFNSPNYSLDDYIASLDYQYFKPEISEISDDYIIQKFHDSDIHIIGKTGDENIKYILHANDDDSNNPIETLKEYKELLNL